jgi:hypothetical protein
LFGSVGGIWSGWVEVSDSCQAVLREEDGSVSVGFEIDSNIEMSCCMVKVLDTGRDAADLDASLTVSYYDMCKGCELTFRRYLLELPLA